MESGLWSLAIAALCPEPIPFFPLSWSRSLYSCVDRFTAILNQL